MKNPFIISEIRDAEKKLGGYHALLNFRYSNLCIEADPASLLPVTIVMGSSTMNIEEMAEVATTDNKYQLMVLPKYQDALESIQLAVFQAHPEFKVEVKSVNDQMRYLLYEMPEVNKERYDFLHEAVKGLHDECKARIEAVINDEKLSFAELYASRPDDLDEANKGLDEIRTDFIERIGTLLRKKQTDIDLAYLRYQDKMAAETENDPGYDVTKGMKMSLDEVTE